MSGSPPVKLVQTAGPMPAPRVSAKVTELPHGKRRLEWHLRRIGGQWVVFMEDGPGAPPRVPARTDRAAGGLSFRPADVPQRKRQIVAVVEEHGKPRARRTVVRYTAPPPPRLERVTDLRLGACGRLRRTHFGASHGGTGSEAATLGAAGDPTGCRAAPLDHRGRRTRPTQLPGRPLPDRRPPDRARTTGRDDAAHSFSSPRRRQL